MIVNCGSDREDLRKSLDSLWFLLSDGGQILLVADGCTDPILQEMIAWYCAAGVDVLYEIAASPTEARAVGLREAKAPLVFALSAGT